MEMRGHCSKNLRARSKGRRGGMAFSCNLRRSLQTWCGRRAVWLLRRSSFRTGQLASQRVCLPGEDAFL